jgi:hypothetical protein
VQLIWAGANGVADPATQANTNGVTVDDVVVAYKWVGFGVIPAQRQGEFQVTGTGVAYTNGLANGSEYYIRAWEEASPGGTGTIPTDPTYYGNSTLYAIQKFDVGQPETFEAGATQPTWYAIPEAGTCGCLAVTLLTMISFRRLRRWTKHGHLAP